MCLFAIGMHSVFCSFNFNFDRPSDLYKPLVSDCISLKILDLSLSVIHLVNDFCIESCRIYYVSEMHKFIKNIFRISKPMNFRNNECLISVDFLILAFTLRVLG